MKLVVTLFLLAVFAIAQPNCSTLKNCTSCTTAKCLWVSRGSCVASCPKNVTCTSSAAACPKTPTEPASETQTLTIITAPVSLSRCIRLLQIQNRSIAIDLRGAFVATPGVKLVFTLLGAAKGSGIFVNSSGFLLGRPNAVDAGLNQPLILVVNAKGSDGSEGGIPLLITVIDRLPANDNLTALYVYAGAPIEPVNMTTIFPNLRPPLRYLFSGAPKGSGLSFNSSTGVLSGTPVGVDVVGKQPLRLQVNVSETTGQRRNRTFVLILTVLPWAPPLSELPIPTAPPVDGFSTYQGYVVDASQGLLSYKNANGSYCGAACLSNAACVAFQLDLITSVCTLLKGITPASPAPTYALYIRLAPTTLVLVAVNFVGEKFTFNISDNFIGKPFNYTVRGLPAGSGLRVVGNKLVGSPNRADANAKQPMLLNVTAYDQLGHNATLLLILTVPRTKPNGTVTATIGLVGTVLRFPLPPYFPPNSTNFAIVRGLPNSSGLKIQANELVGTLTPQDAAPTQPLYLVISALDNKTKRRNNATVLVTVLQP